MDKERKSIIQRALTGIQERIEKPVIQENRRLLRENAPQLLEEINQKYFEGQGKVAPWESANYCHVDRVFEVIAVTKDGKEVPQEKQKHHGLLVQHCGLITPDGEVLMIIEPTDENFRGKATKLNTVWITHLTKKERVEMKPICCPQAILSLTIKSNQFLPELKNLLSIFARRIS